MFEQIIRHKYFFHIVAGIVILTVAILFIVFSGNSAETYVDSRAEFKVPFGQEEQNDTANAVKAAIGREFVTTLDANATTGYEWRISGPADDDLINLVRSEYVPDKTGLVGGGGKSIWTFKALRAGKAQVSFKYIRPWEKDTPPAKMATYVINISE